MGRFWTLMALSTALAACGGGEETETIAAEVEASTEQKPEFIRLKGQNIWVMIIPPGADHERIKPWVKDRCGEVEFCQIFGWTDSGSAARALPMTDSEVGSLAVSYGVNRSTGYESFGWDCSRFPKIDSISCL